MALKVAIQMDPIDSIDISTDSTFVLALEAQLRGYELYHYLPKDLALTDGRVFATASTLKVRPKIGDHFTLGTKNIIDLAEVDVILMRQDPPFDLSYITATHLLEHLHPKTLVVNDPTQVRNAPEKIFITHFPDLMPPTLITSNKKQIRNFRTEYQDIIIKPLFGNGGAGVFHVKQDDENFNSLLEMFGNVYREPIIVQRYEPAVRNGDKRIILIDGEPAGALNRIPAQGESRSNLHVGGTAEKCTLTKREKEICKSIGPTLKERGLVFVGIDVIGDYLTEINVTSPTCLQEINRFNEVKLESKIWDKIIEKL
ncbi:MAG: glutathione synthase [Pseudomonadota bacterium]|nr:glutathione synthase [Pseudomonadota bacterium]